MAYEFSNEVFQSFLTYADYRKLIDELTAVGKTTGENQTEERAALTKLNIVRMNRIDKTTVLTDGLKSALDSLGSEINLAVITEGWCGDAANFVPLANLIASYSEKIKLRFILRDENPRIMDEYLTNGTRSIPLMIVLDKDFNELAIWGPRPAALTELVTAEKAKPGFTMDELKKNIQLWYAGDKTVSTQKEIAEILNKINSKQHEIHTS